MQRFEVGVKNFWLVSELSFEPFLSRLKRARISIIKHSQSQQVFTTQGLLIRQATIRYSIERRLIQVNRNIVIFVFKSLVVERVRIVMGLS